jgi:HSP20 family protein
MQPIPDMISLREAMNSLLEDSVVWSQQGNGNRARPQAPRADAFETEDTVVLELAVPGVLPESIVVTYEQGELTVAGEYPARDENLSWVLTERRRGRFERRFTLNQMVDADRAVAKVENGVLSLTLPKKEEVKPRRIEVVSG